MTVCSVLHHQEGYLHNVFSANLIITWILVVFVKYACIIVPPVLEVQLIVAHVKHLPHSVRMILQKDAPVLATTTILV